MSEFNDRVRAQRAAERQAQADAEAQGLPIFDAPKDNGTATSKAAAARVTWYCTGMRRTILGALLAHRDGLTREEIVEATGIKENSVNGRCKELVDAGWATEDGERNGRKVLRSTRTGWHAYSELERLSERGAA